VERCREGRSTVAINWQAAELTTRPYGLQQSAPHIDFAAAGKDALRRVLARNVGVAEELSRSCNLDRALDEIVSWPLSVLAQVTADEQDRLRSQ
jgi:hypothetical protein